MAPDEAPAAGMRADAEQPIAIVLKPLSHPELGDIRIDDALFAIGRTEAPFASYPAERVGALSRRHARIFIEHGGAYIADLGSKNGTTVNGATIRGKAGRLQDGDEIRFGGELPYRVQLTVGEARPPTASKIVGLTLTPERGDLGLEPIAITRFPFLVGKSDEVFGRYKDAYPHQVNYLSRRHAHIFLKDGQPWIEDLGSTNGTFLADRRLDEHAAPLQEGDLLAFGGHHFVYRVTLLKEGADPTLTRFQPTAPGLGSPAPQGNVANPAPQNAAEIPLPGNPALPPVSPGTVETPAARSAGENPAPHSPAENPAPRNATANPADADKTTFVAAADSFLDIFCVDPACSRDDAADDEATQPPDGAGRESERRRGRLAIFLSELGVAFMGSEGKLSRRGLWGAAILVATLGLVALTSYFRGAPERELKDLLANGDPARAAAAAGRYLERHPDNAEIRALATEAWLKAEVPAWLAFLKARQFEQAAAALADMRALTGRNADLLALVGELAWIGDLRRFASRRGGLEAPIRIYADEERMKELLKPWEASPLEHQRALDLIASYVPEFRDTYAEALSDLRKLQSDNAVYLAAIERLKAAIDSGLNGDTPQALEATLNEYAEKYPRLEGLDDLREDLRQYLEIMNAHRGNDRARLAALLAAARFATPPFAARFRALAAGAPPPGAGASDRKPEP